MFTGDFPHAGVRNIVKGTVEDEMMTTLYTRIERALNEIHPEDLHEQSRAVLDVLCSTPGLVRICRFHCSTEMLTGNLKIPVNTVGFSECVPNPLDARCLEYDDESDDEEEDNVQILTSFPEEDSIPTLCESDGQSPQSYGSYTFNP